jgi:hypothetical protein
MISGCDISRNFVARIFVSTLLIICIRYSTVCRVLGIYHQSSITITVYHLPTKANKHPLSTSVCRKQMKVCRFHFIFAENKQKLPFYDSFIPVCGILETWGHGHRDMETWKH